MTRRKIQERVEPDDICGFCGEPGADKIPHPVRWPTEERAGTDYVHAECEQQETIRAFEEFRFSVGQNGIQEFLRTIR